MIFFLFIGEGEREDKGVCVILMALLQLSFPCIFVSSAWVALAHLFHKTVGILTSHIHIEKNKGGV